MSQPTSVRFEFFDLEVADTPSSLAANKINRSFAAHIDSDQAGAPRFARGLRLILRSFEDGAVLWPMRWSPGSGRHDIGNCNRQYGSKFLNQFGYCGRPGKPQSRLRQRRRLPLADALHGKVLASARSRVMVENVPVISSGLRSELDYGRC
jgi:hypothetical protein